MSVLSKAKQDARAADRAAREKAAAAQRAAAAKKAELQRKAKQDVRAAERALRERAREDSGRTPGDPSAPKDTREIFQLAGSSAGLRSPVDATLDPAPDGPGMEGFATGGGLSFDGPEDDSGGYLAGVSFDSDGDSDDEDIGVGVGMSFDSEEEDALGVGVDFDGGLL